MPDKSNPRFTIHPPSVQKIEPSFNDPIRKLNHTSKYGRSQTSGKVRGIVTPILRRGKLMWFR